MRPLKNKLLFAVFLSATLHAFVFALAGKHDFWFSRKPDVPKVDKQAIILDMVPRAP